MPLHNYTVSSDGIVTYCHAVSFAIEKPRYYTHTHAHTHAHTQSHTHTHTHAYTHTGVCTHTYTHSDVSG